MAEKEHHMATEAVLTTDQLAERYGVSVRTVAAWRARGEGPPHLKIGRRIFYAVRQVEEWEKTKTEEQSN